MDPDNLNTESRICDLIALWLEDRRSDVALPDAVPILPNAWSDDKKLPSLIINAPGYTTTAIVGEVDLTVQIDFCNTTNETGLSAEDENALVGRLRRELARGLRDAQGLVGWCGANLTTDGKRYLRLRSFRHAGGSLTIDGDAHKRTRTTLMRLCVWSDEFTEPVD